MTINLDDYSIEALEVALMIAKALEEKEKNHAGEHGSGNEVDPVQKTNEV